MRCLGEIEGRVAAEKFVAFLLTEGITTQIERLGDQDDRWEIWVREEDRLPKAHAFLTEFRSSPDLPKYQSALDEAKRIVKQRAEARRAQIDQIQRPRFDRQIARGPRFPPLTLTLVILSGLVSLLSNFGRPRASNELGQTIDRQMRFVTANDFIGTNGDPAASLKKGQLWRAITPIFLHLGELHLAFNVLGLIAFGRIAENWLGIGKFGLFVLLAAFLPNLLQGLLPSWLHGSPMFGGISGVVYALFGYVWIRTTLNPWLGINIPFPIVVVLIIPVAIGLSGLAPNWKSADLCHLGGLLVGIAIAFMQERGGSR